MAFEYPSLGSQISPMAQGGITPQQGNPFMQLLMNFFQNRGMQFPGQGFMGQQTGRPPISPFPEPRPMPPQNVRPAPMGPQGQFRMQDPLMMRRI